MFTNLDAEALAKETANDDAVHAEAVEPEVAVVKLAAGRGHGARGAAAAVEADVQVAEAREEIVLPEVVVAAGALGRALLQAALLDLVPDLANRGAGVRGRVRGGGRRRQHTGTVRYGRSLPDTWSTAGSTTRAQCPSSSRPECRSAHARGSAADGTPNASMFGAGKWKIRQQNSRHVPQHR